MKKFISGLTSKSAAGWRDEGMALEQQGNHTEAMRCYDQALAVEPDYIYMYERKAFLLRRQGNLGEAIRCYDQALAVRPMAKRVLVEKGNVLEEQGNLGEAIRCYDQALAINPKYALAWGAKGTVLSKQGNLTEAIRCYDQALAVYSNDKVALNGKASALREQGSYAEAIRYCDQVLAIDPKHKEAWVNKGLALFCQNPSAGDALSYFEKALAVDSNFVYALQGKAIVFLSQGKSAQADLLFDQVVQLMKREENKESVGDMFCMRGDMFFALKNFEVARAAFEQALATQPTDVRAKQRLAKVLDAIAATTASTSTSSTSMQLPPPAVTTTTRATSFALVLDDYHQAIARIAEQERQAFLGLLQTDYQKLLADYQRLGQQGFESNFHSRQQQFSRYLATQQQKLQGQGSQQETQFSQALQTVLTQYPGQTITSLSETVLRDVQGKLQTKLGPNFISGIEKLLNSQGYQEEVQRMQQGILQRIQERQGQLAMEMVHVQQKQKQIANEHDPLYQQYQQQQQTLAEQRALQAQPPVCMFYNTIEKILGSRLMSAMSLASGMMKRESTKSENRVEMGVNLVEKIVDLIPVIGPVANAVIGTSMELAQSIHGMHQDKKQEQKYANTLDSLIRLEDAMALAELVARRLAQSYQQHITQNYLSTEETAAAGENAANIIYGCIKAGGLIPLTTKSVDEKVTHLVKIVDEEAKKQKGTFFRKAAVFKEPIAAQISTATRKQVHALGEDLSKVQEKNELVTKQAQIELERVKKEQAEMKAEFERMKKTQAAQPMQATPQFLPLPAAASPVLRPRSPSFFSASGATNSAEAVNPASTTFSLFDEDNWSDVIATLKNNLPEFFANTAGLRCEPAGKELVLKFTSNLNDKEKLLKKFGATIKKTFGHEIENWEVENGALKIITNANQTTKELHSFFKQALAVKAPVQQYSKTVSLK